jgi:hypothetical protein
MLLYNNNLFRQYFQALFKNKQFLIPLKNLKKIIDKVNFKAILRYCKLFNFKTMAINRGFLQSKRPEGRRDRTSKTLKNVQPEKCQDPRLLEVKRLLETREQFSNAKIREQITNNAKTLLAFALSINPDLKNQGEYKDIEDSINKNKLE